LSSKDVQEVLMTIKKHKARLNLALTAGNTPASNGADGDKLIVKLTYENRTAKRIAHLLRKKARPFAAADILQIFIQRHNLVDAYLCSSRSDTRELPEQPTGFLGMDVDFENVDFGDVDLEDVNLEKALIESTRELGIVSSDYLNHSSSTYEGSGVHKEASKQKSISAAAAAYTSGPTTRPRKREISTSGESKPSSAMMNSPSIRGDVSSSDDEPYMHSVIMAQDKLELLITVLCKDLYSSHCIKKPARKSPLKSWNGSCEAC
jgi:hypothetical protein